MSPTFWKIAAIGAAVLIPPALAAAPGMKRIGEVAALIAEASTADEAAELADGRSGDTAFPFISAIKPLATVGEVDAVTGQPLTGPPDGHAAWLADEATVRVAYQSESTGPMSRETYVWPMTSGATFTGSHIHWIDYDRAGLDGFLDTDAAAATIVKGSGHLFDRVFNVFGNEVTPKAEGGVWGNQALPDGTLVEFAPELQPIEADFYFHSFCAASYEKAG
ncbi:MAG: hypothetical protein OEM24_03815, partial [Paracoccaceae bacterium]|nr:hypothetical protein [Paracoccaceae bacterium]